MALIRATDLATITWVPFLPSTMQDSKDIRPVAKIKPLEAQRTRLRLDSTMASGHPAQPFLGSGDRSRHMEGKTLFQSVV
jgi:hypothetical protein